MTPEIEDRIRAAFDECGSKKKVARDLGLSRTTVRRVLERQESKSLVTVTGIMPGTITTDAAEVMEALVLAQEKKEQHIALSRSQRVKVAEDKPFVLALFSDLHIGNNKTDYRALKHDTEMVRDCPFCYAISAGDHSENWIGKLGWIAREQHMAKDTETALVEWWFREIKPSLIAVCSGNHDNRTILMAGIDYIRMLLGDAVMLYDQDQIVFTLETAQSEVVFKIRHRDQYRSILNPFHGAFRDFERGDTEFDVWISGHDHKGTMFADYLHHGRPKKVCRLGTYKMDDRFGKFIGFARSHGTGSGALIITPTGEIQSYNSISMAIQCCKAMRA